MWWRNFIYGVFFGFLWGPCTRLLSIWFPGKDGAKATSIWMSSTLSAGVIAPAIALPIAHHISWQVAFLVVAALGVPAFVMLWLFAFDRPRDLRGITDEEVARIEAGHMSEKKGERLNFGELGRALLRPSVFMMAIATALGTAPTWLPVLWLPYGLITVEKVNPDTVASDEADVELHSAEGTGTTLAGSNFPKWALALVLSSD
jgi:MFS family permease